MRLLNFREEYVIEEVFQQILKRFDSLENEIRTNMATKDDLKNFATKDDLNEIRQVMATKDDLKNFATKDDLNEIRQVMATKDDVKEIPAIKQAILEMRVELSAVQTDVSEMKGDIKDLKVNDQQIFKVLSDHQEMLDYVTVKSVEHDLRLKRE